MRSRPDSSTRWSRRRPGSTPPRPRRAGNKMADRAPNRFACLSSLCLLRDSRILLLLAAQDAASPPPPSRRSLLLPTLALSLFSPISLSLCLLISPCLSVSLPRFPSPTLPFFVRSRSPFVVPLFRFSSSFSQSHSCSIATDMSSYSSARLCRRIFSCVFLSLSLFPSPFPSRSIVPFLRLLHGPHFSPFVSPAASFTLSLMIRFAGRCRLSGNQTVRYLCRACSMLHARARSTLARDIVLSSRSSLVYFSATSRLRHPAGAAAAPFMISRGELNVNTRTVLRRRVC